MPTRRYVVDGFSRRASGSWGSAETGGRYSLSGGSSDFSVDGSTGIIRVPRRNESRAAVLSSVDATNIDARFQVWTDRTPSGYGPYIEFHARRVDSRTLYRALVRLNPNGTATIGLLKVRYGDATILAQTTLSNLRYSVGQPLWVRVQVQGTNPTTLSMRAWTANTSEPTSWALTVRDNDNRLQRAGEVGLQATLVSDAGTSAVRFFFDNFEVIEAK